MKNSKLIKVMRKFSNAEWARLGEFVHSPYFNTDKKVRDLFDFIYRYAPNLDHRDLTDKNTKDSIHLTHDDKDSLIKLRSRLFKVVELFIQHDIEMEKLPDIQVALLRFYRKRSLSGYFENINEKIHKKQHEQPYQNADYYFRQSLIEDEYSLFLTTKSENSKGEMNHEQVAKALDTYYLIRKLDVSCLMYNRMRISNISYEIFFIDELLKLLPNSDYVKVPTVAIWYQALLLLKNSDNSQHYHSLKASLSEYGNLLNQQEQRRLYTYLENTSRDVFKNHQQYCESLFELYDIQLRNEVLYFEGFLFPAVFKNIVHVGLALDKLEWVGTFLAENQNKIAEEYKEQEDVYSYCLAQLYFKQGKIDDVLKLLNQLAFTDIYTKMGVRIMYLKVYYEKNISISFEGKINSFRKFLHQKQKDVKDVHIKANRDFVNIINKIYYTRKKDQEKLNDIEQQVNSTQMLPEKAWLLEKIKELR